MVNYKGLFLASFSAGVALIAGVSSAHAAGEARAAQLGQAGCVLSEYFISYPSRTAMLDAISEYNFYGTKNDQRFANRSNFCKGKYPNNKQFVFEPSDNALPDGVLYEICMGQAQYQPALDGAERAALAATGAKAVARDAALRAACQGGEKTVVVGKDQLQAKPAPITGNVTSDIDASRIASINAALCVTRDYMRIYPSRTGMMDAYAELNMYGTKDDLNINANARFGNRSRFCASKIANSKAALTSNALDAPSIEGIVGYEICMGSGQDSSGLTPAEHNHVNEIYSRIMAKDSGLANELGCR